MGRIVPGDYFYSQEPYWDRLSVPGIRFSPAGDFMLMSSGHLDQWISCIPGNGQIGMILRFMPGEVRGTCSGIRAAPASRSWRSFSDTATRRIFPAPLKNCPAPRRRSS